MTKLYYTAPSDTAFDEMKSACIEIWKEKGNIGGYSDEKIARIKDIKNIEDNFMFMFAMFDVNNQGLVTDLLSEETRTALRERMIDGGNDESILAYIGL